MLHQVLLFISFLSRQLHIDTRTNENQLDDDKDTRMKIHIGLQKWIVKLAHTDDYKLFSHKHSAVTTRNPCSRIGTSLRCCLLR